MRPSNYPPAASFMGKTQFSSSYATAVHAWLRTSGGEVSAALYEGSDNAGGFALPVTVAGQVVPLAGVENAVRRLATVIPTTTELMIPFETSAGAVGAKAESGITQNAFSGISPSLGQFRLSAFTLGGINNISLDLFEDVNLLESFLVADMERAENSVEEPLFLTGAGVGEPQGMIGNVGAGVTEEPDSNGNLIAPNGIIDLIDSLNADYQSNANFLMARSTANLIRRAQASGAFYEPIFTRTGGQDYIEGYPVYYSAYMPVAARGSSPILFGDFAAGYLIGDRGGPALRVKIVDQAMIKQGIIQIITYRRTDGRVRRPEAIQQYNIAAA